EFAGQIFLFLRNKLHMQLIHPDLTADRFRTSLGFIIGRAARAMGNHLNQRFKAAGHEVTVEHWKVLNQLWLRDGMSQQELSGLCARDKTSMTRLLDTMQSRNLIVRIGDKADRRSKQVHLTHRGEALRQDLIELADITLCQARKDILPEELAICRKVLSQLAQNLEEDQPERPA
ncbi:MAG: MarR family transcriptional regulator, partial [Bacteroidota bacterium]